MTEEAYSANTNPLTEWFESRSTFLYMSILVVAAAIIMVSCLREPVDYDSWWHLKMGQDLVEKGLSPFSDHYSFTYFEAPITQPPVLFQVAYYHLNEWFGERGGQVAFKLTAYLGLLVLFVLWLRQVEAPVWVRVLVISLLVTAVQGRMQIRPELISYCLTVIAFMLYWRASKTFNWRSLIPIGLLLLFWANYHNPLFGYIVFFGLFVDVALRQLRAGSDSTFWLRWAGWGVVLVSIGFLRPDGQHFLTAWLSFSPEWRENIREYFAPVPYLEHVPAYLWMLAAAAAALLVILQKRWGYAVVLLVFLYGGISMSRMVVPALVVVLCVLAVVLSDKSLSDNSTPFRRLVHRTALTSGNLVSLVALALGFIGAHIFLNENRSRLPNVPVATLDYMEETGVKGNIFNVYKLGGYILYRLGPELSVYIDGRTDILYPIEHFLRYNEARDNGNIFRAEVEKYDIDFALLANNEAIARMMHTSNFKLEYSDSAFSLYRRGEGRFETLGELSAYPYCTDIINIDNLLTEAVDGFETHSDVAFINGILALAYNYRTVENKEELLNSVTLDQLSRRPSKRLYAALAMKHDMNEQGVVALTALDFQLPRDMLAAVLMRLRHGDRDKAISHLRFALRQFRDWQYVYQRDLEILLLALREVDPDGSEGLLEPEARAELEQSVQVTTGLNGITQLSADAFCSANPLAPGSGSIQ